MSARASVMNLFVIIEIKMLRDAARDASRNVNTHTSIVRTIQGEDDTCVR
jgi:hypothetical protein